MRFDDMISLLRTVRSADSKRAPEVYTNRSQLRLAVLGGHGAFKKAGEVLLGGEDA